MLLHTISSPGYTKHYTKLEKKNQLFYFPLIFFGKSLWRGLGQVYLPLWWWPAWSSRLHPPGCEGEPLAPAAEGSEKVGSNTLLGCIYCFEASAPKGKVSPLSFMKGKTWGRSSCWGTGTRPVAPVWMQEEDYSLVGKGIRAITVQRVSPGSSSSTCTCEPCGLMHGLVTLTSLCFGSQFCLLYNGDPHACVTGSYRQLNKGWRCTLHAARYRVKSLNKSKSERERTTVHHSLWTGNNTFFLSFSSGYFHANAWTDWFGPICSKPVLIPPVI